MNGTDFPSPFNPDDSTTYRLNAVPVGENGGAVRIFTALQGEPRSWVVLPDVERTTGWQAKLSLRASALRPGDVRRALLWDPRGIRRETRIVGAPAFLVMTFYTVIPALRGLRDHVRQLIGNPPDLPPGHPAAAKGAAVVPVPAPAVPPLQRDLPLVPERGDRDLEDSAAALRHFLRRVLPLLGWNCHRLAVACGRSPSIFYNFLRGPDGPSSTVFMSWPVVEDIGGVLGLSFDQMIGRAPMPPHLRVLVAGQASEAPAEPRRASNLFDFEGHGVAVLWIDGEPWFIGRDVASLLGYKNPSKSLHDHCKSLKRLDYNVLLELGFPNPPPSGLLAIPKADVFRLISGSTLPKAQAFERWVYDEVLVSVDDTGSYTAPQATPPAEVPAGLTQQLTELRQAVEQIATFNAALAQALGLPDRLRRPVDDDR